MASEEQELEQADREFQEQKEPGEEEATRNMQILTALGFKRYDDTGETNFNIKVLNMKIGVKFNTENPAGKIWAYELTEDNKKDFVKNGDLKQLPLVQRYLNIKHGIEPIPESTVTGRIIEKIGKGLKIEIKEDGEKKEIFFGQGAIKRHDDGSHFIPSGFSKPSKDNPDGKMDIPRDILVSDIDMQAEAEQKAAQPAPVATTIPTKSREEEEAQRIREEQGRAPATSTAAKPTVPELIEKYLNMLVLTTEAVNAEERISERQKGYSINWICDAIKEEIGGEKRKNERAE